MTILFSSTHSSIRILGVALALCGLFLATVAHAQQPQVPTSDRGAGWWPTEPERRPPVVVDERRGRGDVEGREERRRGDRGRRGRPRGDQDREDKDREDRDERWERDDRDTERRRPRRTSRQGSQAGRRGAQGGGPPFCRNGSGHPVHGMEWCREKGFAPSRYEERRQYRRDRRYDRRRSRERRRRPQFRRLPGLERLPLGSLERFPQRSGETARLAGAALARVLSARLYRRLSRLAQRRGARQPVEGRLLRSDSGRRALQLRAGRRPLAELIDSDGNGRVDRGLIAAPMRR